VKYGLVLLTAGVLTACGRIDTTRTIAPAPTTGDPDVLAAEAEAAFAVRPRMVDTVRFAFGRMVAAARSPRSVDRAGYDRLVRAARYAVWLALALGGAGDVYADSAIMLANTALGRDSSRVEAWYYRAIGAGLWAREHESTGRDAMRQMRDDATRAIGIDSTFDRAGPSRVLGALYLRAPGPPAGIGSTRRAVPLLEQACRIAPGHTENRLFLAEAYMEQNRAGDALGVLSGLEADIARDDLDPDEREERAARLAELRHKARR